MGPLLFENLKAFEAGQPSNEELRMALSTAMRGAYVQRLRELRRMRTTWFGKEEHALMLAIDRLLRSEET